MRCRQILAWGCLVFCVTACDEGARDMRPAGLPVTSLLGNGNGDAFEQVLAPRAFVFPQDWGSHPGFRSEWWYFTGNVDSAAGRHYGFELTFFRFALRAAPAWRESAWAARDVWMAHLAVTDALGQRFVAEQRLARDAFGLAGAQSEPFKVWVESWAASGAGSDTPTIRLSAGGGAVSIELDLQALKPVVAQGDGGMDRKGADPGNASYYYSVPRMAVSGTITLPGIEERVQGLAWIDREWGSTSLPREAAGWDWFGLQLADGRELMFYRLRDAAGGATEFSGGALVAANGARRILDSADVTVRVTQQWQSAESGVIYPGAWHLEVPSEDLAFDVVPYVAAQELNLAVRYWEGAVAVRGEQAGRFIEGSGYVELTGY
jgi:predicted secreted hydrolase